MTNLTTKWNKEYWADFGERVGTTLIYQLIALLTLDTMDELNSTVFWTVVGLPVVLSALKNLLMNMKGEGTPTASLLGITSNKERGALQFDTGSVVLLLLAIVGVVVIVLAVLGKL